MWGIIWVETFLSHILIMILPLKICSFSGLLSVAIVLGYIAQTFWVSSVSFSLRWPRVLTIRWLWFNFKKMKSALSSPKSLLGSLKVIWLDCQVTPRHQREMSLKDHSLRTTLHWGEMVTGWSSMRKTPVTDKFVSVSHALEHNV